MTRTLNFARRGEFGDWSIIEMVDDSVGAYNYTSLAYDPRDPLNPEDDTPSISYRLWSSKKKNPGLKFAYKEGSNWILEMVDPGVDTRHGIGNSLVYDPDTDEATIAYLREDTLKFFRRAGPKDWSSELVATVPAHRDSAGGGSLAYDGAGNPSIAFTVTSDIAGDDILTFARRVGSSWVIEQVDACRYCGKGKSLAYAADGTAYISYTTDDNAGGRMVKLAQRIGDDNWQIEIVTSCVWADPTSLDFDPLGNPSVAYSDDLNEQLKLARIVP